MAVMDAKPRARSTEEIKKDTGDTQVVVKREKDEVELLKDVSACLGWLPLVALWYYIRARR
jgi:hypothetical protein